MDSKATFENEELEQDKELEENESSSRGGPMSLREALKQRGTTMEDFVKQGRLEVLLNDNRASKLKQMKSGDPVWSEIINTLKPTDVVYPSVQGSRSMYGNALMSRVVRINLAYFNKLSKNEKRNAIDAIVRHFEDIGSRFLEAPPRNKQSGESVGQSYRFFSLQGVTSKVLYLFRIQTFRLRKKLRLASGDGEIKSLDNSDESFKINPSVSSNDRENNKDLVNQSDSRPKPDKKPKKVEKPHDNERKNREVKKPKQIKTQASLESSDKPATSRPTVMVDAKDAGMDERKSKQFPSYLSYSKTDMNCKRQEMERFVVGAQLGPLLKLSRSSKLVHLDSTDKFFSETFHNLRSVDVVLPCPGNSEHPPLGNALLNHIATLNMDAFAALSTDDQKQIAVNSLVAYFERLGTRFVKPSSQADGSKKKKAFQALTYELVKEEIYRALRSEPNTIVQTRANSPSHDSLTLNSSSSDKSHTTEKQISYSRNVFQLALSENFASRERSMQRFLRDADIPSLLKTYQPSAYKGDTMWGQVFQSVRPLDVVLPRNAHTNLGNALLNDVVSLNCEYYSNLSSLQDRQVAVDALVGAFEKLGTRFLEALPNVEDGSRSAKGPWRVVSYRMLFEKITKLFRASSPRQMKELPLRNTLSGKDSPSNSVENISLPPEVLRPIEALLTKYKTTLDRFVEEASIEKLLNTKRASKLSRLNYFDSIEQSSVAASMVKPEDVLLLSDDAHHPGNVLLELVVNRAAEVICLLNDEFQKEVATDAIVAHLETIKTRFLVENGESNSSYKLADYKIVLRELLCKMGSSSSGQKAVKVRRSALSTTFKVSSGKEKSQSIGRSQLTNSTFRSYTIPRPRVRPQKRVFSEVETLYQSSFLSNSKRVVIAPRPVFFE